MSPRQTRADHVMTLADGGVELLERAVGYTRVSLQLVSPGALGHATPCRGWDLRTLLAHMDDSLAALQEAADLGHVDLDRPGEDGAGTLDLVCRVRARACALLGAWSGEVAGAVSVAGSPLGSGIVAAAGAVEIAVHGWDVARTCGETRPLPPLLAQELLELAPLLVTDADRATRFGQPVDIPAGASASDRLLAHLGRSG